MKITKKWLNTKLKLKTKIITKGCQKFKYMHQIACIYIVAPQQMWNNTYLETTYNLEERNIANFCFQNKELTRIRIFKFF